MTEIEIPEEHWQRFGRGWTHPSRDEVAVKLCRAIAEHPDPLARFDEWLAKLGRGGDLDDWWNDPLCVFIEPDWLKRAQAVVAITGPMQDRLRARIADQIRNGD